MNKRVWVSIKLNDSIDDDTLKAYIDHSYEIVDGKQ